MRRFAEFISLIFHPVTLCLFVPFLIVYRQTESGFYALKWVIFSSLFIGAGIIMFLIELIRGSFSDFDLTGREERYKFYTFCLILALCFFVSTVFFKGLSSPLSIIAFGIILGIALIDVVNHYTKASIHVGVVSAFIFTVSILYGFTFFSILIWILPLTMWARVYLKRHTIKQAIIGGGVGFFIALITLVVGRIVYPLQ